MPRTRAEKYPYDKWVDGNLHTIRAGMDFESRISLESMQKVIRYGFRKRGFKLQFHKIDYSTATIVAVRDEPL